MVSRLNDLETRIEKARAGCALPRKPAPLQVAEKLLARRRDSRKEIAAQLRSSEARARARGAILATDEMNDLAARLLEVSEAISRDRQELALQRDAFAADFCHALTPGAELYAGLVSDLLTVLQEVVDIGRPAYEFTPGDHSLPPGLRHVGRMREAIAELRGLVAQAAPGL